MIKYLKDAVFHQFRRATKEQREGIARLFDGWAIATSISMVSAISGHLVLSATEIILLPIGFVYSVNIAFRLRGAVQ